MKRTGDQNDKMNKVIENIKNVITKKSQVCYNHFRMRLTNNLFYLVIRTQKFDFNLFYYYYYIIKIIII